MQGTQVRSLLRKIPHARVTTEHTKDGERGISAKHAETSPLLGPVKERWDEATVVPLHWNGEGYSSSKLLWSLNSPGFSCWSPWSPGSVGAWMWLFLLRERHSCQLFLLLPLTHPAASGMLPGHLQNSGVSPEALKWIETGQYLNEFKGSLCTQENSLGVYFPAQITHKYISFWKVKQQELPAVSTVVVSNTWNNVWHLVGTQ